MAKWTARLKNRILCGESQTRAPDARLVVDVALEGGINKMRALTNYSLVRLPPGFRPAVAIQAVALQAEGPAARVRLNVDRQDGSNWKEVNSALVFNAGDKLRFRVSANFPGYLYVMNHGTSGGYELLFPRSDTGADNRVEASKEYMVPSVARLVWPGDAVRRGRT